MKNKKRLLAILLCIVLCASMLPATALAESGTIAAADEGGSITAAEPEEENEEERFRWRKNLDSQVFSGLRPEPVAKIFFGPLTIMAC